MGKTIGKTCKTMKNHEKLIWENPWKIMGKSLKTNKKPRKIIRNPWEKHAKSWEKTHPEKATGFPIYGKIHHLHRQMGEFGDSPRLQAEVHQAKRVKVTSWCRKVPPKNVSHVSLVRKPEDRKVFSSNWKRMEKMLYNLCDSSGRKVSFLC